MMSITTPSLAMREGLKACTRCSRVAKETLTFALFHGAEHAEADHLRRLMDCAEICQTTADFLLRASPQHGAICRACIEVCKACAEDARAIGTPELQRLADHCGRCAAACDTLAAAADVREIVNRNRDEPELYA